VAGANVDQNGETFIKLGWNPIYLEDATPFKDDMPNWGVKIECDGEGCNGLPCAIDPAENKVNEMVGSSSNGAGGGAFCVVTVPKGVTANFVVFDGSGGTGHSAPASSTSAPTPASSSSAAPGPTAGDTNTDTDTDTDTPTAIPSSSVSWAESSSSVDYGTSPVEVSTSSTASSPKYSPHQLFENSTSTYTAQTAVATPTMSQTSQNTPATTGGASAAQLSIASLVTSSLIVLMAVAFSS
jgi:hypothetical protein